MFDMKLTKDNSVKTIKIPNVIGGMFFGAALAAGLGAITGTIAGIVFDVKNIVHHITKK